MSIENRTYYSDDFDFGLNEVKIQKSPRPISEHRLYILDTFNNATVDSHMQDICDFVNPGDVLVFNDSKVLPVSLYREDGTFFLFMEPRHVGFSQIRVICPFKPKVGEIFEFQFCTVSLTSHEPGWDVYRCDIALKEECATFEEFLETYCSFPLPIYIERIPTLEDEKRLQSVFAAHKGSIAPPVAGSHFDEDLISKIESFGIAIAKITLHVGYGTFRSFKTELISSHKMDEESYRVEAREIQKIDAALKNGGHVIAVGTTAARVLETLGNNWQEIVDSKCAAIGETDIFITPPYKARLVSGLLTNFQYPRLPVIVMAAAFVGLERLRTLYLDAYAKGYCFYSYGDAMLLKFEE